MHFQKKIEIQLAQRLQRKSHTKHKKKKNFSRMKFVALISGGKDSIHNVLKCVEHGHELVALANLQPPPAVDELDSWMYQSVGHELVAAYAVALGVPLLRRETHGRARCTALRYAAHADDEVEQLGALLDAICAAHPAVRGVAVGTILSDYQRLRVEHVCRARQLVPLAYLWQREQRALVCVLPLVVCSCLCVCVPADSRDSLLPIAPR